MDGIWPLAALLLLSLSISTAAKQAYIVHMKHNTKPDSFPTHHDWYTASLQSLASTPDSLLYTYTNAFDGFAASLSDEEVELLKQSQSVVGVYEDTLYSLHTTRTPAFLGLNTDLGPLDGRHASDINQASKDVIVGVLDTRFAGVSLYSGAGMGGKPVGLAYNKGGNSTSNLCMPGSLEPKLVRGKVVICDRGINPRVEKGAVVRDAGGVGMILANTAESGEELVADSHLLPAVAVGRKIGDVIREYVKSDPNPTAVLSFEGTVLNVRPSPVVAAFSSRGPNLVTREILKPDLIGPGVNILAAWSETIGPTGLETDTRKIEFNIMSGTSMSCPHISGVAALLKAAHPTWSPSAMKSALMTTAYVIDNTNSSLQDAAGSAPSSPWAHGSGHVDLHKALSPGLVYDISTDEYIAFLCSLDYTIEHVQAIVKRPNITCSRKLSNPR
ncbi:hypothetical protein OIU78_002700 [Salix suchowensis]|nr:hypothetical protein OIU78_002700 [Salix suchowensis]